MDLSLLLTKMEGSDEGSWSSTIYIYTDEYKDKLHQEIDKIQESKGNELNYKDFSHIDTFHPAGHAGLDLLLREQEFTEDTHILDIGCGVGGTSRHIVEKTPAHVYGLDYLDHFVEIAQRISTICNLNERLEFHQGDINTYPFPENRFDGAIAITIFLIVGGTDGFRQIFKALKPGGFLYFEDYYLIKERDEMQEKDIKEVVEEFAMPGVRSRQELTSQLEGEGFVVEKFEDFTRTYSEFAWNRSQRLLSEHQDGGEQDPTVSQMIENYGRHAPKLLCEMSHLSPEELQQRYPLTCSEINFTEYVYGPKKVGSVRLLARKPMESQAQFTYQV